ncbi:MAG: DUF2975 domain-containing protein [Ruminococcaceae bacterium]|nr:DUF2975 domain-containing protein [Oscillospiraceae bacterium]
MSIKKLSVTAKRLDTFFRILQKFLIVCLIAVPSALLVLTIATVIRPGITIGTNLNVIDFGNISITLAEAYTPENNKILFYSWIISVLAACGSLIVYLGLRCIRRILAPMIEGKPFHQDISRELRKLSFLSLALGILQNITSAAATFTGLYAFNLHRLLESGVIQSVNTNLQIDLTFLIAFFLLLLMSYIFSYGAELQKLSDETL